MPARSIESFNPVALKAAREAAGWTMRELAQKIGQKHPTTICVYETGKGRPSQTTLSQLGKALRVPAKQLTGGGADAVSPGPSTGTSRSEAPSPTVQAAVGFLRKVAETLIAKNAAYGDSTANPRRVFSKADAAEQLLVRIDDKLSRISTVGFIDSAEDSLLDLVGYLALLAATRKRTKRGAA